MTKINLEIDLSTINEDQTSKLVAFIESSAKKCGCTKMQEPKAEAVEEEPKEEPTPEEEPKAKKAAKTAAKKPKAEKPKKEEPKAAVEKEEPKEEPEEANEEGLTLEEVRAKLNDIIQADKDNVNRDKCVEKLKELGAKNMTTLDASKYQEFFDFMQGLN